MQEIILKILQKTGQKEITKKFKTASKYLANKIVRHCEEALADVAIS